MKPRWFPLFIGGLVGPVLGVYFFDASARTGVVIVLIVLVLGVLYLLPSDSPA